MKASGEEGQDTQPIPAWRVWMLASRPRTLTAAVAPVLVGSALAGSIGSFKLLAALAAGFCAVAIQVGTNILNDVSDFERGADTEARLGPLRVTQAGLLPPATVRRGAFMAFGVAALAGTYLVWAGGWPILLAGLAAILAGIGYSVGPSPLAYNGLADLMVMIFFGFVAVCGTVYVQAGTIPGAAWLAALGVGSTITGLLAVNNYRDWETDRAAGRHTIPAIWGPKAGLIEFGAMAALAYLAPLVMWVGGWASPWILLGFLTLPSTLGWFRFMARHKGGSLNFALAGAARWVLLYAVAISIGMLAPGLVGS